MSAMQIDTAMRSAADVTRTFIKANPAVTPEETVDFLLGIYGTLNSLRGPDAPEADPAPVAAAPRTYVPALPIEKSISADRKTIYCLVDGKPLKMLKRYLKRFDMTPESYRAAFGLPADYPMSAPAYSEAKREEAKLVGLGSDENKAGLNKSRMGEQRARELVAA